MSKIEELIQQLCSNGVEWKTVGELCNLSRGKVYSKQYLSQNEGEFPVYSSQTANNGELGKINSFDYDGEFLTWTTDGAYAGTIFHRKGKFSITNVCGLLKVVSKAMNIRFLYYWLSIKAKDHVYQGMGNPKLMSNQVSPIPVPLPSLPVQEEIVRILDAFTSHAAELQARREQYEYYRNKLLSFDDDSSVEWKTLDDLCTVITDGSHSSPVGIEHGYPMLSVKDMTSNGFNFSNCKTISEKDYNLLVKNGCKPIENDVLIAKDGSMLKYVFSGIRIFRLKHGLSRQTYNIRLG